MSADDAFKIAKNCVKCNAPKPDHAKRHERAHVTDDSGEDNAESHDEVSSDEIETAHWANDNDHGAVGKGTGNDFGLTATHVVSTGHDSYNAGIHNNVLCMSGMQMPYGKYLNQWIHM
jgi:hypothetical protein